MWDRFCETKTSPMLTHDKMIKGDIFGEGPQIFLIMSQQLTNKTKKLGEANQNQETLSRYIKDL